MGVGFCPFTIAGVGGPYCGTHLLLLIFIYWCRAIYLGIRLQLYLSSIGIYLSALWVFTYIFRGIYPPIGIYLSVAVGIYIFRGIDPTPGIYLPVLGTTVVFGAHLPGGWRIPSHSTTQLHIVVIS